LLHKLSLNNMPVVNTKGAASSQGFGEFAKSGAATYIEDVFSTYLYTGNGSTQTITNGIDLSGKGGLVWIKSRSAATDHKLTDTVRGATKALISDTTGAQTTDTTGLTAFVTTGFTIGADANYNTSAATYVSWAFRKTPKFFDVVTWTGDGTGNRVIPHSLASVPGCMILKRTDAATNWSVWHNSLSSTTQSYLLLNDTAQQNSSASIWGNTAPTSTNFTVGSAQFNASAQTYVAYLFASNAGGFGLTGTDNVITCGSFTTDASANATINLGYEPQWVLIKPTSRADDWKIFDNMRGWAYATDGDKLLIPNSLIFEQATNAGNITSTGFTFSNATNETSIYIAIRRGPMKTPTVGTSVFGMSARAGTGANATVTGGQTDDAVLVKNRGSAVASLFSSRLTGTGYLVTSAIDAEASAGITLLQANPWDVMDGVKVGTTSTITNASGNTFINYLFKRAPSFFDMVCYTGTGANTTVTHNLGVVPEMMIVKKRNAVEDWGVYTAATGNTGSLRLNTTGAFIVQNVVWNNTSPTSSVFTVGTNSMVNATGDTYVWYGFATLAGVSKVGSYTGTGATQTISCGFTGGARFVLMKRTDTTGDWYIWDTARGMVSGTDPSLLLNTTAAEVNANSIYTATGGFQIVSTAAGINASGGTYIFLAIA
jgi:hypothetical protein